MLDIRKTSDKKEHTCLYSDQGQPCWGCVQVVADIFNNSRSLKSPEFVVACKGHSDIWEGGSYYHNRKQPKEI